MKRPVSILLALALLFGLSTESWAGFGQPGIKMALNVGTPVGPKPDGASGAPGFQPLLGGFYEYHFNPKWGVRAEFNFYMMKAKFEAPYEDFTGTAIIDGKETLESVILYADVQDGLFDVSYLQMPIMAVMDLGKNFNLTYGVYISKALKKQMSGEAVNVILDNGSPDGQKTQDSYKFDEGENINDWEFGLNIGAEYEFTWGLLVDLRASGGLTSFFDKDFELAPGRYSSLNFQAGVAYRIGGKKMF